MTHKIIIFVLMILLCSCKKDNEDIDENLKITSENPQPPYNQLKYKMIFPDTIQLNRPYEATIVFESDFDTILPPVQIDAISDSTKTRLITFYQFEPIKSPMKDENDLILKDSMFVLNKKFSVKNIVFKEKGTFTFCGLIFDEVMYNYYDNKGKRDSIHFTRRKQQIFKNVVVID
ncbi:hypothetical protein QW060_03345 [Myroides ceti]|uniref:Lipoprotein n=1 Tax=Paenimyroides ceti TaxID=395087 RepID=A0ABT8CQA2_9FLAO|nr:hypothetical protein [Paenimyroides ceti]MDN3706156.1 hypothetical protein [Paenimyroides ceti]